MCNIKFDSDMFRRPEKILKSLYFYQLILLAYNTILGVH